VATKWRDRRVFLAGDAAHQTPPFYGQGMCHGIRDVRNLLWKVSAVLDGTAGDDLLDTYEIERVPHVQAIIEQAVSNGRYICTLDPEVARQRDRDLREQAKQPKAARSFRDIIPGLSVGLLSETDTSEARGLLFPQPEVVDRQGRPVRFDEILGSGFALVSREPIPDSARSNWSGSALELDADFRDPSGLILSFFDTFGLTAAVVRPDRYVFGGVADQGSVSSLISAVQHGLGDRSQDLAVR
jgi:3-(3-hydroxy-phenyl)propionate hydroxylase